MIRTFVDSDILIAGARALGALAPRALATLADPDRTFVVSDFLRLELLPKPTYHRKRGEVEFYEAYFASAVEWVRASPQLVEDAFALASRFGLRAIDALNVAAAAAARVDEFVTGERTSSPLLRVTTLNVISLHASAGRSDS